LGAAAGDEQLCIYFHINAMKPHFLCQGGGYHYVKSIGREEVLAGNAYSGRRRIIIVCAELLAPEDEKRMQRYRILAATSKRVTKAGLEIRFSLHTQGTAPATAFLPLHFESATNLLPT
jgi:hypothetical protein